LRKRFKDFKDYASLFRNIIYSFEDVIVDYDISIEEVTPREGLIRGAIVFLDGSRLYFLEYVLVAQNRAVRLKYRYHYEDPEGKPIFRYDNAPHHPEVETHPHHKHLGNGRIIASKPPSIKDVLDEILSIILSV